MAVNPDAEGGRIDGRISSCKKPANQAGKDISAPAFGHARIPGGVDEALSAGAENAGMIAFHHDVAPGLGTEFPGEDFPLCVALAGEKPLQLALVRGQDRPRRNQLRPVGQDGEDVQGIGVQDHGDPLGTGFEHQVHEGIQRAGRPAQAGADGDGLVTVELLVGSSSDSLSHGSGCPVASLLQFVPG